MGLDTLLNRAGKYYNTAKLGAIGTATATVIAGTVYAGASLYSYFNRAGTFERAATAYFIASDESQRRIEEESQNLRQYIAETRAAREELEETRRKDFVFLEQREQATEKDKFSEIKNHNQTIKEIDKRLEVLYQKAEAQLEKIAGAGDELAQYSTIWRRAVKVEAFITYEYLKLAKETSRKIKKSPGIYAEAHSILERFGKFWNRNVNGVDAQERENIYQTLRQRIRAYTTAEVAKQGIANVQEALNRYLKDKSLSESERKMYELMIQSITDTKGNRQALEILAYLENGKIPRGIGLKTKLQLRYHRNLIDTIETSYQLIAERVDLVHKAEKVGIEIEKDLIKDIQKAEKRLSALEKELERSDKNLSTAGINPRDPDYLSFIEKLKYGFIGLIAGVSLVEMLAGLVCAREIIRNIRIANIVKKNKELAHDNEDLKKRIENIEKKE